MHSAPWPRIPEIQADVESQLTLFSGKLNPLKRVLLDCIIDSLQTSSLQSLSLQEEEIHDPMQVLQYRYAALKAVLCSSVAQIHDLSFGAAGGIRAFHLPSTETNSQGVLGYWPVLENREESSFWLFLRDNYPDTLVNALPPKVLWDIEARTQVNVGGAHLGPHWWMSKNI